jgi:hypothetical protein
MIAMRTQQYLQGRRNGIKWAITLLHQDAAGMKDEHARRVLDNAAFHMGVHAKWKGTFSKEDEEQVPQRQRRRRRR